MNILIRTLFFSFFQTCEVHLEKMKSADDGEGFSRSGLLLKHTSPQKSIDFNKCVICKKTSSDTLLRGRTESVTKLVDAAIQREDDLSDILRNVQDCIEKIHWHATCYAAYTSKENLRHTKRRRIVSPFPEENMCSMQPNASSTMSLRSMTMPFDSSKCVFCKKQNT